MTIYEVHKDNISKLCSLRKVIKTTVLRRHDTSGNIFPFYNELVEIYEGTQQECEDMLNEILKSKSKR